MNLAQAQGDIDLEDCAEKLLVSIDPTKAVTKKIRTPPSKRRINLKNRLAEYQLPLLFVEITGDVVTLIVCG